jgi:hypothetical protein
MAFLFASSSSSRFVRPGKRRSTLSLTSLGQPIRDLRRKLRERAPTLGDQSGGICFGGLSFNNVNSPFQFATIEG